MSITLAPQKQRTENHVARPTLVRKDVAISFSEMISALSFAIDLTEGEVPGHALRTCLLGMKLGRAIGLPEQDFEPLYYALLLKDVGCSSNAARLSEFVGGDERAVKKNARMEDWTRPHRTAVAVKRLWQQVLPESNTLQRVGRMMRIGSQQQANNVAMIQLRSERGARIVTKLGLSAATAKAVHALDEHWDGSGHPDRLEGEAIPLLARILAVAQHLDVFACERSPAFALQILRKRSGRWFDPTLVKAALRLNATQQLWAGCRMSDDQETARKQVLSLGPKAASGVGPDEIDRICSAFADIVDAKSPFTYRHSVQVAQNSVAIAKAIGLAPDRVQLVHRAALLHDLGKLSVSNAILDKTKSLTTEEWSMVMEHPRLTRHILAKIEPFAEMAQIAGAHHEKLDGSGYPEGLQGHQMGIEARIIAVADIYSALTEERPYRSASTHAEAVQKLRELTPDKVDERCVNALSWACAPSISEAAAQPLPAPKRKGPASAGLSGIRSACTATA